MLYYDTDSPNPTSNWARISANFVRAALRITGTSVTTARSCLKSVGSRSTWKGRDTEVQDFVAHDDDDDDDDDDSEVFDEEAHHAAIFARWRTI